MSAGVRPKMDTQNKKLTQTFAIGDFQSYSG